MAKKPNRPITAAVFPKKGPPWLRLDELPTDKDNLELEIARRFVVALNNAGHGPFTCGAKAAEPGDVIIHDALGQNIPLQIGEAVDIHRTKTTELRSAYGTLLWENTEMREQFCGVQTAMMDMGEARDLPKPRSQKGQAFLSELTNQMLSLQQIVVSLPSNAAGEKKGIETFIDLHSIPMKLNVRLLRYASPDKANSGKWLWTGTHPVRSGDELDNFAHVVKKKIHHYGKIASQFWLLVYSVDSHSEPQSEAELSAFLENTQHPFTRICLFVPVGESGTVKILFPRAETTKTDVSRKSKKVLARFLPQDMVPKWNDPRWVETPCRDIQSGKA